MADQEKVPARSELIYLPRSSWAPALTAAGLAAVIAGLFAGWFYALVGALLFLAAAWTMLRDAEEEMERLPRRQRVSTAVIPPLPVRRTRTRT